VPSRPPLPVEGLPLPVFIPPQRQQPQLVGSAVGDGVCGGEGKGQGQGLHVGLHSSSRLALRHSGEQQQLLQGEHQQQHQQQEGSQVRGGRAPLRGASAAAGHTRCREGAGGCEAEEGWEALSRAPPPGVTWCQPPPAGAPAACPMDALSCQAAAAAPHGWLDRVAKA
jgi:hypothetical protein